ncbi:diuretic hormone 44 isoform X1 [Ooceraea biroi]|uniref:diuretic hormone 44 isoform X1 n=1 Tax=Ooceraea biroi TaxID=2015173 RepID=UPI000F091E7B|nr:diuretic hormone 44 isoform X1 [Ooceraea biroi]
MAMNVINLHACTMVLIGILMLTTTINLISSAPLSPYEKRELSDRRPKIFLLPDRAMPELESELLETDNNFGTLRAKRIGSLSIVNNLDVLRQKFLLELARRKALQDQRQINENRLVLDSIGKRSVPEFYETDAASFVKPGTRNGHDWTAPSNRLEWIEEAPGPQDDRMAKVQANELRL